jgi:hypothetical protein
MSKPLKKISSGDNTVWVTQPYQVDYLLDRRQKAFEIANGKLEDSGGKIETVMQTAEAFGRGLFADYIQNESKNWTIKKWIKPVVDNVFNPMGTGATFTKISKKEAKSFIFSCSLHEKSKQQDIASVFTYGFMRGLFKSAFPDGEILMGSTIAQGCPMIEFTFKTQASDEEKLERERIKNNFRENVRKHD